MEALSLSLTGTDALMAALRALGDDAARGAAGALYREGERIMTASKGLVPVDTGALRASGQVQPPQVEAGAIVVTLGYGGPAIDYAVIVHEDLTARHPTGQAKYLETPLHAARGGIAARLAGDLQRAVRRR